MVEISCWFIIGEVNLEKNIYRILTKRKQKLDFCCWRYWYCSKSKSYLLSRALGDPQAFVLGHTAGIKKNNILNFKINFISFEDPCTHGIWLATSALTMTRSDGKEVIVLLMDCEGISSVKGNEHHDAVIFVLSILLSEVLIFNCVGVPSAVDFQQLQLFSKLSESVTLQRGEVTDEKLAKLKDHFPHLMVCYYFKNRIFFNTKK